METGVSSASPIADLLRYLRTRFPLAQFVSLALFLALAAGAVNHSGPVQFLWRSLLVLPWLLQFRLADDLADRERDIHDHPGHSAVIPTTFRGNSDGS
jgi:4-hydroxybenzoate polyprenyltransferase